MTQEVILTGSFGVGKSSIFNRFIYEEFSAKYYGSIGVRVNERLLKQEGKNVSIKLWDVAGEIKQNKVPSSYFNNKDVILYVIDLNRPFTFANVPEDLVFLKSIAPASEIKVIGNKRDILTPHALEKIRNDNFPITFDWITSAKTGENINDLFRSIAFSALNVEQGQ